MTPSTSPAPPRFSVLVSSYNYQDHVVAAVESALAQSQPPYEVIVVDDGSTDESVARLNARFGSDPRVRLITQRNSGQLAAWITGFAHSSGDLIALLDSDDLWTPAYLETLARVFVERPTVDIVFCNMKLFGAREGLMLTRRWHRADRDLGTSVLLGCFHPRWQGVATSGNAVRRLLMSQILALPEAQVPLWRTRPDDCLFYGSDILGGHKFYLAAPLAMHREHASNALLQDRAPLKRLRYELRRERMLSHYREAIDANPRFLLMARLEFRTKPQPTFKECRLYMCMALAAPQPLLARIGQAVAIAAQYLSSASKRRSGAPSP